MNVRDVESILESHPTVGEEIRNWYYWQNDVVWGDHNKPRGTIPTSPISVPGLGDVSVVELEGGSEGEGDHMHIVFRVINENGSRFFKKSGYYSSWDSSDWDGPFTEVYPREKLITVYED